MSDRNSYVRIDATEDGARWTGLFTPAELDAILADIAEHIPVDARSNALVKLIDIIDNALYS